MILQREKPAAIWGKGKDGERVRVSCREASAETTVQGGRWLVHLPPMEAGGPFELEAESAGVIRRVTDVWYGDVWLAGGQSNMEMQLKSTLDGLEEANRVHEPRLRLYEIPPVNYDDGQEHAGSWRQAVQGNAAKFSAVAYYFAREIVRTQNIPVGIISCSKGATFASCWVDEKTLKDDPVLRIYWDEYIEQIRGLDLERYFEEDRQFNEQAIEYYRRLDEGVPAEQLKPLRWPPPIGPRYFLRPCGMYESMLKKAMPYALKGFLYYQGEADAFRSQMYERMMKMLVSAWRRDWRDPSLPFLFVQLSNFGCMGDEDGEGLALQREAQWHASQSIPGAAMAVSIDCGDIADIHPQNKRPVGERLALLARERVYGEPVDGSGPTLEFSRTDGDHAVLRFVHDGGGLAAGGGRLQGFELADENEQYVPAVAVIASPDTILVRSDRLRKPVYVRYGWRNWTDANLFGGTGLPASPFRARLGPN